MSAHTSRASLASTAAAPYRRLLLVVALIIAMLVSLSAAPPRSAAAESDGDGDGLPDTWEVTYGLNPASAAGHDGAAGDPDGDGMSNASEFAANTHPRGFFTRYLAEGAAGSLFDTTVAIANPGAESARALLRFLRSDKVVITLQLDVPGRTRRTVVPREVAGLMPQAGQAEFSTVVESDRLLVVDRTLTWDLEAGYGSHSETSVERPSTKWYFAEGATHSGFDLFYLLQNATSAAAQVRVTYLLPSGAPIVKDYTVGAASRFNIWANTEEFPNNSGNRALASTDVSAVIEVLNGVPIIAERAMYLSRPGQLFAAGHESAGVTAPASAWFLAEGATGDYFDLYVLLANPNAQAATVRLTYLLPDGRTYSRIATAPPNSRSNVWVDYEQFDGVDGFPLVNTAVSTTIESTNGVPIIVERALWWPGPTFDTWFEAHNSAGSTSTGLQWAVAEGEVGGVRGHETYYLVANTSPTPGNVDVTLLFESGAPVTRSYALAPTSRTNVPIREDFPEAAGKRFGAVFTSTGATPARIVVERAMYSNAGGITWAAGTNALAARMDGTAASVPTVDSLTVQPTAGAAGQQVTLSWTTTGATSVAISPLAGAALAPDGTSSVSPAGSTTFTLTAVGPGGEATRTATYTQQALNHPPTAADDAAATVVNTPIDVAVLTNDVDQDGDALSVSVLSATNGTATVFGTTIRFTPAAGFIGQGTCAYAISDGRGGTAQALVRVDVVSPPVDPTAVESFADRTSFLWGGSAPRQQGAAPGAFDVARVSVVRGRVQTRDGAPLVGVTISAAGQADLGHTSTDSSGRFDFAANGGGTVILQYAKNGYLTVQRRVSVPWNDFATAPTVVMIPSDSNVTAVSLSPGNGTQVARGSQVTDEAGSRQATLIVPEGGIVADIELPDGSKLPAVSTLHIRATEYTVGPTGPQAMPGDLPPASGYTYAVELSADEATAAGAERVTFSTPLVFFLENFLDFPVGTPVPVGFYDKTLGAWVAADNGVVVKVLGTDANGRALLDVTGSGAASDAATLQALGVTDGERQRLASLYPVGRTLWRVPIPHFSSWDCNWPWGFEAGADGPRNDEPENGQDEAGGIDDEESKACGSIIGCQTQTLGEVLPLVGTGLTLHYTSARMAGYAAVNTVRVPLTGATPPASLKRVLLQIDVAGQHHELEFAPAPDLSHDFAWDGRDAFGRLLQGTQLATVRVGYVYDLVYRAPASGPRSFGGAGGAPITASRELREGTIWQVSEVRVGGLRSKDSSAALGGWTLSAQHSYDPAGRTLYYGDGQRQTTSGLQTVTVVAGSGVEAANSTVIGCTSGTTCDALAAKFQDPSAIATAPDGTVYIGDASVLLARSPNGQLRKLADLGHTIRGLAVAGTGTVFATASAGGPLHYEGGLYSVTPAGVVTEWFTHDEFGGLGPIALGPDGSVYFAVVQGTDKVYRLDQSGNSDHAVVWQASVTTTSVKVLAVAPDGALLIGSHYNKSGANGRAVERIGPDGVTTVIAGKVDALGYGGEGLAATATGLGDLHGLQVTADGTLYLLEHYGNSSQSIRLRRIDALGVIATVAGGTAGWDTAGDGGPAYAARFKFGEIDDGTFKDQTDDRLDIDPAGRVLIADGSHFTVRSVVPAGGTSAGVALQIPSDDGSLVYEFDGEGRHLRTRHGLTGTTLLEFAYSSGRLVSVTDANGNVTTIERATDGRATGIVGPFGQRTTLAMDAAGYLASATAPGNLAFSMTYDAGGLLTQFSNPRSAASTFEYDSQGRLARDRDAATAAQTLVRQDVPGGYSVTLTSAEGTERSYKVEQLPSGEQRLTSTLPDGTTVVQQGLDDALEDTTSPDGTRTIVRYGGDPRFGMNAPLVTSAQTTVAALALNASSGANITGASPTNPFAFSTLEFTSTINGRVFRSLFDQPTRTFTDTSPAGRQVVTTVDVQGRPTTVTVPGLTPVSYGYDARGRVKTVTQGTRAWTYDYDALGQVASVTDPIGHVTSFHYDASGRVIQQLLPGGATVAVDHDAAGNVTGVTPPGRPEHVFAYNLVDLPTEYTPPAVSNANAPATTGYDLDRQPVQVVRPDGLTIGIAYDGAGRLASVATPTETRTHSYSASTGQLTSITTPDATLEFSYQGPLVTQQRWSGPFSLTVAYGYDNNFRVTTEQVGSTPVISFGFDNDGLLTQAGAQVYSRSSQNGLVTGTTLGVVSESYGYNGFGEATQRTVTVSSSPMLSTSLSRDDIGRITQKVETLNGVTTTTLYAYDTAGRLANVTTNGVLSATYLYDANGNRTSATEAGLTSTAAYDNQDRMLTRGAATYAYTPAGELATKVDAAGTSTYTYDVLGNLRAVSLPSGSLVHYLVDGANRRIGRRVNGTLVQGFVYQDQLRVVAELNGAGAVVSRFVYGLKANVPEYMVRGGQTFRIVTDHLGSPRLVINTATGVVAQEMNYDAWGRVMQDTSPGFQPFGFAGGLYDALTGLVRFGARDYDAAAGRWTSKDPLGLVASLNLYVYVAAEPVNQSDPSGKLPGWRQALDRAKDALSDPRVRAVLGEVAGRYVRQWQEGSEPGTAGHAALSAVNAGFAFTSAQGFALWGTTAALVAFTATAPLSLPALGSAAAAGVLYGLAYNESKEAARALTDVMTYFGWSPAVEEPSPVVSVSESAHVGIHAEFSGPTSSIPRASVSYCR